MDKHVFVVTGAERGFALEALLARRLELDLEEARRRIGAGSVYVDGRRQQDAGVRLTPGQKVTLFRPGVSDDLAPALVPAHEDREVVVVDKPPGLLSAPDRRGGQACVEQLVRERWGAHARLLHRLDRDASGLLLVSRRQGKVRRSLAAQISGHRLRRRYLAIVRGAPSWREMAISGALSAQGGVTSSSQDPRARQAQSRVRLIARGQDLCVLQVSLETGRTHQIRAHLAEMGLPILGDTRYGGPAAPRLALHAHCLGFKRPQGHVVEIHSPMPGAMSSMLGTIFWLS